MTDALNRHHAIDRAEFNTRLARRVDPAQQLSLDEFVKTELMQVIDEVFDGIERNTGVSQLSLDRLEIDLGEINFRDYRQQMPQRLRRQLWQALDNARYTTAAGLAATTKRSATSSAEATLFHFLRHGNLPGYAARVDAAKLDSLLRREIETHPARLVEFISTAVERDSIMRRIEAQFPAALQQRVARLLESPDAAGKPLSSADPDLPGRQPDQGRESKPTSEAYRQQLEVALSAQGSASFAQVWRSLMQDDALSLFAVLHDLGRRRSARQKLARLLTAGQFAALLRVIEPTAHEILLSGFEPGHWLSLLAERATATPAAAAVRLREWMLGYLLVERAAAFDRHDFVQSLVQQISAAEPQLRAESWAGFRRILEKPLQAGDMAAELARLALAQVEQLAGQPATEMSGLYRRYARLQALFFAETDRPSASSALADLELLAEQAPWLLLRLLRELQTAGDGWQRVLRDLSAPFMERLGFSFLKLIEQSVSSGSSAGTAELVAAIKRNAERARNRQAYYGEILLRLVGGEPIDFNRIVDVRMAQPEADNAIGDRPAGASAAQTEREPGDDNVGLSPIDPRAARLIQFAELLTTASLAGDLKISAQRLQAIKWRYIETYVNEVGYLFNPVYFVEGFAEALRKHADIGDSGRFYSLLGQALLQNSLLSTRGQSRRLIEALDELAAETTSPSDAGAANPVADERASLIEHLDEVAPDEDIHLVNAGLVLLAPWLPRLFDQLGFVVDGKFKDRDTAERAVHCVQFLVDGNVASPEYQLVLNKLLCGVRPGRPIRRGIDLSDAETEQLESLLSAVTQHWKALENTSIDGLRESFLQRGGRLQRKQDAWHLAVETRAYDLLLDQLPWSYSTIKFAWMDRVIYVDWR